MAMSGSAIGLGNIWRFPYLVGEYGGAAFVLIYIMACLFISLPIFLAEAVIGRRSGSSNFGAFNKLVPGSRWRWLALLTVFSPFLIVSYYSVVGGWATGYLFKSFAFEFSKPTTEVIGMFGTFSSNVWMPLICHTIFLGLTAGIVAHGVKKGIEKFSNWSMPVLFLMILIIMIYSLSLPGAEKGVEYLVKPDFSKVNGRTVASAMGQSFYSLSLGVGTILTYYSYVSKKENILVSGLGTAAFDLLFAIMSSFAVMGAVFAAGIEPGTGPGLIFESIPFVFNTMGQQMPVISSIVAILFFLTVLISALTSAVSLFEVGVAYLTEERGMSRRNAVIFEFVAAWLLGALCSLSFGPLSSFKIGDLNIFSLCDTLASNFFMTLGGFLFVLFVGWKMKRSDVYDELTCGGTQRLPVCLFSFIYFLMRYVAPLVIGIIFISGLIG